QMLLIVSPATSGDSPSTEPLLNMRFLHVEAPASVSKLSSGSLEMFPYWLPEAGGAVALLQRPEGSASRPPAAILGSQGPRLGQRLPGMPELQLFKHAGGGA